MVAPLNWLIPASTAATTRATWTLGRVMKRGTDIQNGIVHIPLTPACLLAPVISAFSASKSHFGPARTKANGAPIAVAVAGLFNINLNCGDIPTPTGIVIAPNTVLARMTVGDIIGGLFAMLTDAVIQALMNSAFGMLGPCGSGLAQMLVGSPLGFSFNASGKGAVGALGRQAGNISDWARGFGEKLGGDVAQGEADMAAAKARGAEDTRSLGTNPFAAFVAPDIQNIGILSGIASALETADRPILRNAPPGAAFDNALAEQF